MAMPTTEYVFHGGLILNSSSPQKVEGFTVKNGVFEHVFTDESVLKNYIKRNPDCQEISLKGQVILPGQVDGHVVSAFTSRFMDTLKLDDITDSVTLRTRLQQYAASHEGTIVATGWQDSALSLSRNLLNELMPTRALVVHNASFHGALLNDTAMKEAVALGVKPTADMVSTGRLWTVPYEDYLTVSRPDPATFARNILAYQEQMLSKGITAAHDLLIRHADELQVFQALGQTGQLKIHWRLYTTRIDLLAMAPDLEKAGVKLVGHKIFVDGSYGMSTAWQDKANAYPDGSYGHAKMTREQIIAAARATVEAGGQSLAIHCIGFAACRAVTDSLQELRSSSLTRELRMRAQHFQTCNEIMLHEAAKYGLFVNMQPAFSHDVNTYADRIKKPELVNQLAMAARLLKDHFSLGSDGMPLGYLPTLENALYPPLPHQRPADSLVSTLPMATRHPARILGDQLTMGCIKNGLSADFTIISHLPRSQAEFPKAYVAETWVKGQRMWQFKPEVVTQTAQSAS